MNITTPTRLMSFFSFPHDDSRISNSASLSVGSGNRAVFLKCLSLWETNTLDSKPPISDPKRMLRKCFYEAIFVRLSLIDWTGIIWTYRSHTMVLVHRKEHFWSTIDSSYPRLWKLLIKFAIIYQQWSQDRRFGGCYELLIDKPT